MGYERRGQHLDAWRERTEQDDCGPLRHFANGLRRHPEAVQAGRTESRSNRQTEGKVHRLKLLKRRDVWRAVFAVSRRRMVQAA